VPNVFEDLRSAVELLHGGDLWICSSRAIFSELELSQTRPKMKGKENTKKGWK
jgi:hypothetical protein